MIFLKLYEGYPEPIVFELRWSVFGFFWEKDVPSLRPGGFTVRFFRDFYQYDAAHINTDSFKNNTSMVKVRERESHLGLIVRQVLFSAHNRRLTLFNSWTSQKVWYYGPMM